ncbi:MAG: hypothetical protein AABX88_02725 [Nanoarchaeota archaeon]
MKRIENFGDLSEGQRIYLTAESNTTGKPVLIIGDFHGKSGIYLTLKNYSHKYIKLDIASSESSDVFSSLSLLHERAKKNSVENFALTSFRDYKIFI